MTIESQSDIVGLQCIGRIASFVLHKMLDSIEPGMTTRELDAIGERLFSEFVSHFAPQLTYGFPGSTYINVNEQAAHGVPSGRVIEAGDLVNVDVSAKLKGYFADTGGTTVVPPTIPLKRKLCHTTRSALSAAIKAAMAGQPINRIGVPFNVSQVPTSLELSRTLLAMA